jgi:putative membrane protein
MKAISIIFLAAFIFAACENPGKMGSGSSPYDNPSENENEGVTSAPDPLYDQNDKLVYGENDTTSEKTPAERFILTAASGGMMEVRLGQLAVNQASSQQVKDFGQMMVQDHGQANQELRKLAQDLNVELTEELKPEHQQKVEQLKDLKGEDFDRQYMQTMEQVHQQDVQKFQEAQNQLESQELDTWISQTLPVLEKHLQQAKQINGNNTGV